MAKRGQSLSLGIVGKWGRSWCRRSCFASVFGVGDRRRDHVHRNGAVVVLLSGDAGHLNNDARGSMQHPNHGVHAANLSLACFTASTSRFTASSCIAAGSTDDTARPGEGVISASVSTGPSPNACWLKR